MLRFFKGYRLLIFFISLSLGIFQTTVVFGQTRSNEVNSENQLSSTLTLNNGAVINASLNSGNYSPFANGGDNLLISNESVNPDSTAYTGTFKINNSKYTMNKNLSKGAYKLDVNRPFDMSENKSNKIVKKPFSLNPKDMLGDYKNFWVQDFKYNSASQITAKLMYSGSKANVWVYNNYLSSADAQKLGGEFEQKIYALVTNNFGKESDVDGDNKINILCYDIQDGFSGSGGYISGYFYGGDLFDVEYSNQSEIFYIDTYPSMGTDATKDLTGAYSTLVHEFQHMVNFNQNIFVENNHTAVPDWLNEGLSMAAEQMYWGKPLDERIDYYNYSYSISRGHSLLKWENNGDVLSNYALSYLFMEYVKTQAKQGNRIFKEMMDDKNNDYRAVQDVLQKYVNPNLSFGQYMTAFRGALVLKQPTGLYGFNGDTGFNTVQTPIYYGGGTDLDGGGAIVVSGVEATIPRDRGANITYTDLSTTQVPAKPNKPVVNGVSDASKVVTGIADPNVQIGISVGNLLISNGSTDSNGKFSISIPKQKAGTMISVFAVNKTILSDRVTVTVVDRTPPNKPKVNLVSDADTTVKGKAEAGASIIIKVGAKHIGNNSVDGNGNFSIKIPKQKAGTTLIISITDKARNKGPDASVKVIDKTPPQTPTINKVTPKSTTVSGKTEAKATVFIKIGTKTYKVVANTSGVYRLTIAKQKKGTKLSAYAQDMAGNKSRSVTTTVK